MRFSCQDSSFALLVRSPRCTTYKNIQQFREGCFTQTKKVVHMHTFPPGLHTRNRFVITLRDLVLFRLTKRTRVMSPPCPARTRPSFWNTCRARVGVALALCLNSAPTPPLPSSQKMKVVVFICALSLSPPPSRPNGSCGWVKPLAGHLCEVSAAVGGFLGDQQSARRAGDHDAPLLLPH